jgi:hypothetical protein
VRIAYCVRGIFRRRLPKLTRIFLATKTARHEENLIADYADDTDLIGHKKAQKLLRNLDADCDGDIEGNT